MRIVLASHHGLAKAMMETAEMVLGKMDNTGAVGLYPGTHPDDYLEELKEAVDKRAEGEPVLIICDLLAGTPFNVASRISFGNDDIKVIYGMNLGMVVEAFIGREGMTLDELTNHLMTQMPVTYGVVRL